MSTPDHKDFFLPPEWHPQSGVMLTWPHAATDWNYMLQDAESCFINIAREIAKREKVLVVSPDTDSICKKLIPLCPPENLIFANLPTNDTWARDHGALTLVNQEQTACTLLDFTFNAWGLKFAAEHDNQITRKLFEAGNIFSPGCQYSNQLDFVLEGGSIEVDGMGTILTTSECLLSPNRNPHLSKKEIENRLISALGMKRVLWLENGYLEGDDTDSHIDTLARFCPDATIAYVRCADTNDPHYSALKSMETELQDFRTADGLPYRLVALPMAESVYAGDQRLPATYANFLIINGAVLVPVYGSLKDKEAIEALSYAFPGYEIIPVNCLPLIHQHGSLHCVTMQFPMGVL
ncbi:MAG: agmatine deiminase family protein [Cyclobacteriaceae bacterium]|nr:agmatine deiminase family protein [Cyclobacteriaceae bacterium]